MSTHPLMEEILDALERLAERVANGSSSRLDDFVSLSLRRLMEELRRFIPGLDAPPDASGAHYLARASDAALQDGDARETLSRSLRGLALSPHSPNLWYLVASACFEFGTTEDAVRALRHTLWIHPGHRPARRDLSALNLYLRDRWEGPGEMTADEAYDAANAGPTEPDLAFDLEDMSQIVPDFGDVPDPGEDDREDDEPEDE